VEPIREGLIREIHKRLVEGVRGNSATPGEYRKIQNYVANSKTKEIIYTPPLGFRSPSYDDRASRMAKDRTRN
jgi:Fic family protein